jgi:hypothetical protein
MRGELDDALARLARREEVLRRRSGQEASTDQSPLGELTEAVQRVVAKHPELAVTMWVSDGAENAALRVDWSDGQAAVTPIGGIPAPAAGGPPSWPMSVKTVPAPSSATDGLTGDSAARLAELIRHDPSLLGGPQDES